MNDFYDLLEIVTENWLCLPVESQEKITQLLSKINQRDVLKQNNSCRNCQSKNIKQSGIEVICLDCDYTFKDYSSDN